MMNVTTRLRFSWILLFSSLAALGCSSDSKNENAGAGDGGDSDAGPEGGSVDTGPCVPDESGEVPARPEPGTWQRVDIPGAVCSNGSPYPIFVNYSATSNNVVLMLEPGGACWDYGSCAPGGGLRGAANPDGIAPGIEHMTMRYQFLPLLRSEPEFNPAHDYNKVFIPYCTGDIHTGNNVATYEGPNGEMLEFHHNGHENVRLATEWLNETFTNVPKLLVTGCSAGGAGALLNYHFIRQGMDGDQCGYLLDDSGPIFPSTGNSAPLHAKVRESWNTDSIIESLDGEIEGVTIDEIKQDFGLINIALANTYKQDRLALTVFRRDLNYSLYSYENFYDNLSYTDVHDMWEEDLALLRDLFDTKNNLAYFMPFYRIDNCSHCVSIPPIGLSGDILAPGIATQALTMPWLGSEIQESDVTLQDYVVHLLDDTQPLESYLESEQADEGFTPDDAAVCQAL